MTTSIDNLVFRFAGIFVLASLLLAHYHSPYWLWFTAFVGFNLPIWRHAMRFLRRFRCVTMSMPAAS